MTMAEKALAMEQLTENEAFLAAYQKVESKGELQQLFAQYGVELEKEEVDAFVDALKGTGDELDAEALDNVAGGAYGPEDIFGWAWSIVKKTGKWAWNKGRELANWENSR